MIVSTGYSPTQILSPIGSFVIRRFFLKKKTCVFKVYHYRVISNVFSGTIKSLRLAGMFIYFVFTPLTRVFLFDMSARNECE